MNTHRAQFHNVHSGAKVLELDICTCEIFKSNACIATKCGILYDEL